MEEKKYLAEEQIEDILNGIIIPFDSIKNVITFIEKNTRNNLRVDLLNVKIYPSMFTKLKQTIINSYNASLIQPNFPIGPLASDSFGQQATQNNLNTFHNIGSNKGGGSSSIREAISFSANRKVEYSIIHFKNESMNYKDIMNLQKDFLKIDISFLSKTIKLQYINFDTILESKENWWYKHSNYSDIQINNIRPCIRIKFDIQKLFEYKITTNNISNIIEKTLSKKEIVVKCIYSPTIYGIVDIFILGADLTINEYLLQIFNTNEFSKIIISGLDKITNFYTIKKPLISLIRDGEQKNGKLHLYIINNRFIGIPFSKLAKLIELSGYKIDSSTLDINDIYTLFDYNPSKNIELRKKIIITAYDYKRLYNHSYYTIKKISKNEDLSSNYELDINLPYINSPYTPYSLDNLLSDEFISFPEIPIEINKGKSEKENLPYPDAEMRKIIIVESVKCNYFNQQIYTINMIGNNLYELNLNLALIHQNKYTERQINSFLHQDFINPFIKTSFNININKELYITASKYIPNNENLYNVKPFKKNIWKITFNNFNYQYTEQQMNNIILKDFLSFPGKKWEITKTFKLKPIKEIIIDTLDSYDNFISKLSAPISSNLNIELIDNKISLTGNNIDTITKLLIKSERNNFFINNDKIIIDENDITKFKKDFIKTEDDILKSYFYAETSGTSLKKILLNPNVNKHKTWCNNFHQIFEIFGIETLRNFLVFDFKNMINNNGYINNKFFELAADVQTNTGLNPMTSEGIGAHGGGALKYATFDRVSQYLTKAMLSGKSEKTNSTSVCIALGQQFNLGTGGIQTEENKIIINSTSPHKISNDYDYNIQSFILDNNIQLFSQNGINGDENNNTLIINIPIVTNNQLPIVPWIYENIINKHPIFYIKNGINNFLNKTKEITINIIDGNKFIINKNKICKKILFNN